MGSAEGEIEECGWVCGEVEDGGCPCVVKRMDGVAQEREHGSKEQGEIEEQHGNTDEGREEKIVA